MIKKKSSKVTVVMPCYNDGDYIRESVASIHDQSFDSIELLIVNDGSTDEHTIEVLKQLSNEGISVFAIENCGPAAARNFGIEKAIGEYVLPLDADDLIDPTYIEKAVNILDNNQNVGVVYCEADLFGEENHIWNLPKFSIEQILVENVIFVTALFRKSDWEKTGGFSSELKYGLEDHDFWLSILELGRDVYQIPEVLFHYRKKGESRSTKTESSKENLAWTYNILLDRHPDLYKEHLRECISLLQNIHVEYIFQGREVHSLMGALHIAEAQLGKAHADIERAMAELDFAEAQLGKAHADIERAMAELDWIRTTSSYRMGRLITAPIRFAKKLMSVKKDV